MLQKIDMVAVYVHDWNAALSWYVDRLGLAVVFKEDDHRFAVLGLPVGGPVLHLVEDRTRPMGGRNRCAPNFAVDDFDATLTELKARGIEILEINDDPDDGYRLATIADPEGNDLNIYAYARA